MCRIPRADVAPKIAPIIIEHLVPRKPGDGREIGQGLDYGNLLAVCHGNKAPHGSRKFTDLTCDAHRGNTELRKVNPCRPETLKTIFYSLDGKIDAEDSAVRWDLVETLNLNGISAPLTAERKSALDSLIADMGHIPEEELFHYCNRILKEFKEEKECKTPYAGILIWYLQTTIDALCAT